MYFREIYGETSNPTIKKETQYRVNVSFTKTSEVITSATIEVDVKAQTKGEAEDKVVEFYRENGVYDDCDIGHIEGVECGSFTIASYCGGLDDYALGDYSSVTSDFEVAEDLPTRPVVVIEISTPLTDKEVASNIEKAKKPRVEVTREVVVEEEMDS